MTAELLDFQIVKLVLSYLYQYKLICFDTAKWCY